MEIWPSDLDYGILGYEFEHGIGGKLKSKPEDFIVTEVDPKTNKPIPQPPEEMYNHGDNGGLYLVGRAWKRNIDHAKMKKLLAKTFKVREDDISTAGIKDKRAITTQLFSVYQPRKNIQDPLQIVSDLEIDSFRYYREKMYPGRMGGNYFEITIRDTNNASQGILDSFNQYLNNGMLNYFGYQRFGGSRPITAEFGRLIINGDFKSAIDLYLGGKSSGEDELYREMWRSTHDPDKLLMNWENIPMIERDILSYLSKRRNDYAGSIRKFPEFLIQISRSAFISLLFNNYISRRGEELSADSAERLVIEKLPNNGGEVKNIEVALPSARWEKPLNDIWESVFDRFEINPKKDLKKIKHNSRMLKLYPRNFNGLVLDNNSVKVSFQLPAGAYATTVLRELMQVIPNNLC